MARGESERGSGNAIGAAILSIFAACALAALAFVVVTTRACQNCDAWLYGGAGATDPYVGASTAAAELGWRDAARARSVWGAPLPSDPAAAAAAVEPLLEERGYVPAEGMTVGTARELPATFSVPELAGGCGVVEVIAEPSAHLDGGRSSGAHVTASDPSLLVLGTCDGGDVSVEGVGRFTARAWHLPGLVPGDPAATGLPADVLLAHAEAERMLGRYGYVATADAFSLPLTGSAGLVSPIPPPSSGCVPWVVVAVDAGMSSSGTMSDRAPDRTLALAVTCATRIGWDVTTTVATGGGTAFVRAYRPPGSGAAIPGEAPTTAGSIRLLDPTTLAIPPGVPEAP